MMTNNDGWQQVGSINAEAWKPEKVDDSVDGMYVDMKDNVGPNGSKIYTLQQDDGSFVSVWGSAVIDARMIGIPLGDQVKIVYLGTVPNKISGRKPTKMFDIFRKPATEFKERPEKSAQEPTVESAEESVDEDEIPF